jgi:hypothetical protein
MLLPVIGAGLGGFEAYRRTGGDIGATLLGAGLGAATPGALRMAGQALGATGLGAALTGRAAQAATTGAKGITGLASGLGKTGVEGIGRSAAAAGATGLRGLASNLATPIGIGGLAAGVGTFLGAPSLAGKVASAAAPSARTAAQAGAGATGYQGPGPVDYAAEAGGALPPNIGTFGPGGTLSDPLQVLGPVGMAQRLETLKTAEAQRDALRLMMPEIAKASEFRSRQELQRQLAAAGVRQNIVTAANMLERSQQAAQQMGLTAASQAGSALTSQYQYQ